MAIETLAEAGDADFDKAAEVAQLREMYGDEVPQFGPGEIRIQHAGQYGGHLILSRSSLRPAMMGSEVFLG